MNRLSALAQGVQPSAAAIAANPLHDLARTLASLGRNGDTILAHITPQEAAMLKAAGGTGATNPATGLPEFNDGDSESGSNSNGAGPMGGENAAHGVNSSTTEGRDAAYGGAGGWGGLGSSLDRTQAVAMSQSNPAMGYAFGTFSPAAQSLTNVTFDQTPTALDLGPFGKVSQQDMALAAMTAMSPLSVGVMAGLHGAAQAIGSGLTGALESAFGVESSAPSVSYGPAESSGGSEAGSFRAPSEAGITYGARSMERPRGAPAELYPSRLVSFGAMRG